MTRFLPILAILVVLVSCTNAQAIVLDWDTVTWANGSLSNSYDIRVGHTDVRLLAFDLYNFNVANPRGIVTARKGA